MEGKKHSYGQRETTMVFYNIFHEEVRGAVRIIIYIFFRKPNLSRDLLDIQIMPRGIIYYAFKIRSGKLFPYKKHPN
jgi:hypothetical protein